MANKKNTVLSVVITIASVAAAFAAFNATLFGVRYHKTNKKMNAASDKNNLMHSVLFTNGMVKVKENTDNVFANCITGNMTIDFTEQPIHKEVTLDVFSIFGKVTINLPQNAKVKYEGIGLVEGVCDLRMRSDEATSFTLRVKRHNIFSKLIVTCDNTEVYGKRKYYTPVKG